MRYLHCILGVVLILVSSLSCISQTGSSPYLGQNPPGSKAQIFAPGLISSTQFNEYSGTFSPDLTEYYFYRYSEGSPSKLFSSRLVDGKWTQPEPCSFSGGYPAGEPHLTFDNQRLYFLWDYPVLEGQPGFGEEVKYYFVERTTTGWSEPRYAGQGMFMTTSRDGRIFVTDMSARAATGSTYLAQVTVKDGRFTDYTRQNIQPYFGSQAHPCIAPDGSYMLFDVNSGSHLFVSFKEVDGGWTTAIDLAKHGFSPEAGGAYISPDGEYLFFSLAGDIWWVDIGAVEGLKP